MSGTASPSAADKRVRDLELVTRYAGGDLTVSDGVGAVDGRFELVELGSSVAPAFRALPHREQLILKLRFIDDLNQAEIADQVGISQMHVSRLLRRSLARLAAAGEADST